MRNRHVNKMHSFLSECVLFLFYETKQQKAWNSFILRGILDPIVSLCDSAFVSCNILCPCVERHFCSVSFFILPTCTIYLQCPRTATCVFLGCYGNNEEKRGFQKKKIVTKFILCISFWYHDHRWFTRTHIHTHTCSLKWCPRKPPLSLYIVCTLQSFHTFDWSEN